MNEKADELLRAENEELKARLEEAQETLQAIQTGQVDGLVVQGEGGPKVYALQSAEADSNRFRGEILTQIEDVVIALDLEERITYLNAAAERLYGVKSSEVLGLPLDQLRRTLWPRPDDEECARRDLAAAGFWRGENRQMKFSGEVIEIESTISFLTDLGGARTGFLMVIREITARKKIEAEARENAEQLKIMAGHLEELVQTRTRDLVASNEQLEAFVYSIAHDLRGPLRSITGFSTILTTDHAANLPPDMKHLLHRIQANSEFLDRLLLDLLAFGSVGRGELKLEPVEIDPAWQSAVFQSAAEIQDRGAVVQSTGDQMRVLANEATLGQCLANLLSNALKFIAPGVVPRVTLRVEPRGHHVRLWVEDNGIGIAADQLERIFRVFERLNGESFRGTGIGLSIVRRGVERMGGATGVESKVGEGSRFWIELPRAN